MFDVDGKKYSNEQEIIDAGVNFIYWYCGKEYYNEQEIIAAGCYVIYCYCCEVRVRWRDIEHLMVEDAECGYWYARDVIKGRYEPVLEILYLMKHNRHWVDRYIRDLVRYGNV